jgi:predicted mannosyl-3-phosphoglycerate phosphatase (HAD superfamily)
VFSDVEAALAGADGSESAAAGAMLRALADNQVAFVLWSSATRAQIEHSVDNFDAPCSFVSEDGSAVFIPTGLVPFDLPSARHIHGYHAFEFGKPQHEVLGTLREVARALGVPITTFSDLSAAEIAAMCSISVPAAQRAKCRDYSERFALESAAWESCAPLFSALAEAGVRGLYEVPFHRAVASIDRRQPFSLIRLLYRQWMGDLITVAIVDDVSKRSPLAVADCLVIAADAESDSDGAAPMVPPAIRSPLEWVETIGRVVDDVRTQPDRYLPAWRTV